MVYVLAVLVFFRSGDAIKTISLEAFGSVRNSTGFNSFNSFESLEIRHADPEDVANLATLMTELGYPSSPEEMRRRLGRISSHPAYHTLVAEHEGHVIGMSGVETGHYYGLDAGYARISALVVAARYRGLGVGRALIRASERQAARAGAESIFLNSGDHRPDAHRFYEASGYEITGYRFSKKLGHDEHDD